MGTCWPTFPENRQEILPMVNIENRQKIILFAQKGGIKRWIKIYTTSCKKFSIFCRVGFGFFSWGYDLKLGF